MGQNSGPGATIKLEKGRAKDLIQGKLRLGAPAHVDGRVAIISLTSYLEKKLLAFSVHLLRKVLGGTGILPVRRTGWKPVPLMELRSQSGHGGPLHRPFQILGVGQSPMRDCFLRLIISQPRGPKMAVPTRTRVEPSSTATAKSPDMPMESSVRGRPVSPRRWSRSSRKAWK